MKTMHNDPVEREAISTIRLLAVDMVEKAKSGHPGLPLGAAPMAYILFTKIMKYNPENPAWLNRDRFVLSAGHGSALLYTMLHLTGYDLSMEELKSFRQLGSKTPGHPEYGLTPGVETTTGPLGQGIATAVGMAAAERFLASRINTESIELIDYHTYVLCSDGDLMEGVSSEASSLAGHLKLGKLVCLYDCNHVSIEGSTDLAFTENVRQRYEAYGWHVEQIDGNRLEAIETAVLKSKSIGDRPSMIIAETNIGYGSPNKQDKAAAHGEPLGAEETRLVKQKFGFPENSAFFIPESVTDHFRRIKKQGAFHEAAWQELWTRYEQENPDKAGHIVNMLNNRLPEGWEDMIPVFTPEKKLATRQASKEILTALAGKFPFLAGGSADLAPSTGTAISSACDFMAGHYGCSRMHFGVREHTMGAMVNGMALSKLMIPYGATFLVFADYMKPAIRIASLMNVHSIFIFTHDSIGLGEDGPTHQPIEQLAMLRATPGLTVIRPADANETAAAWKEAVKRPGPVALIFTRQTLPVLDTAYYPVRDGVPKGAYVLTDWNCDTPETGRTVLLIATGSEVHPALEARAKLLKEDIYARVISMPSRELFEEQPHAYREQVLPSWTNKRIVIEAAAAFGWDTYAGREGVVLGINSFGKSAPGPAVFETFGFTAARIADTARNFFS
jgi:transketolase